MTTKQALDKMNIYYGDWKGLSLLYNWISQKVISPKVFLSILKEIVRISGELKEAKELDWDLK